ncbi:DUF2062 domain-containing protein [Lysinibacillus sp. BW-2-10]|uniref:DUF2062 domain-containing protein n=1 Tax=Lysinibacillus sp. BW-2-10 TaxID=2590030 RepID=UPI00117C449B|nr:DUF2062 domain-containing protein [Lysinibacillus sp. BW-2-10]TSI07671.1 DUF2062 domain-containing protein [Lysinibacillus sp. BW-2-10]
MKIKRKMKYYLIRLFRLKSSPHQVALGLSIGLIPNWLPTFGVGPLLSVGLAKLVKANTVAAFIGGVIGTLIWPLLFILNYQVGSFLLNRNIKIDEPEEVEYIGAIQHTVEGVVDGFHSSGFLFLTGATINIVISSLLSYFIMYFLFKKYNLQILNKISSRKYSNKVSP